MLNPLSRNKYMQEEWVDPDDAPELDEQWFKDAVLKGNL
jgi:hypothetical protein